MNAVRDTERKNERDAGMSVPFFICYHDKLRHPGAEFSLPLHAGFLINSIKDICTDQYSIEINCVKAR
jgi:hypothetical protein